MLLNKFNNFFFLIIYPQVISTLKLKHHQAINQVTMTRMTRNVEVWMNSLTTQPISNNRSKCFAQMIATTAAVAIDVKTICRWRQWKSNKEFAKKKQRNDVTAELNSMNETCLILFFHILTNLKCTYFCATLLYWAFFVFENNE